MRKPELSRIINELPRYKPAVSFPNETDETIEMFTSMQFSYDETDVYVKLEDLAKAFKYPIKIEPGVLIVDTPIK